MTDDRDPLEGRSGSKNGSVDRGPSVRLNLHDFKFFVEEKHGIRLGYELYDVNWTVQSVADVVRVVEGKGTVRRTDRETVRVRYSYINIKR
jgi:hypothetical protein